MVNLSTQNWVNRPKNRKYTLSDGTVVQIKFKVDKIDAKIRVLNSYVRKDGKIVTMPVPVQATIIELTPFGGKTVVARSCCKPPDIFQEEFGVHTAIKRLFRKITLIDRISGLTPILPKSTKAELFKKVCWFLTLDQ